MEIRKLDIGEKQEESLSFEGYLRSDGTWGIACSNTSSYKWTVEVPIYKHKHRYFLAGDNKDSLFLYRIKKEE